MTTTTDLATELAGWKTPCHCHGTPSRGSCHPKAHEFFDSCTCCRDSCRGTGEVYLFDDSVRVPCDHRPVSCTTEEWNEYLLWHESACPGWTASTDLAVWWNAGTRAFNAIIAIRNDGPGWRADVYPNTAYDPAQALATGWSDGGFRMTAEHPSGERQYEPMQIEALLNAMKQVVEKERKDA